MDVLQTVRLVHEIQVEPCLALDGNEVDGCVVLTIRIMAGTAVEVPRERNHDGVRDVVNRKLPCVYGFQTPLRAGCEVIFEFALVVHRERILELLVAEVVRQALSLDPAAVGGKCRALETLELDSVAATAVFVILMLMLILIVLVNECVVVNLKA